MRPIDSVRIHSDRFEEIAEKAARRLGKSGAAALEIAGLAQDRSVDRALEATLKHWRAIPPERPAREVNTALEAIILSELRPAYMIRNDLIEIIGDYDHVDLITAAKPLLEEVSKRVGCVEILNHASLDYVGTGWLIERDIVVTNRHVAEAFVQPRWPSEWDFAPTGYRGRALHVEMNPGRQDGTPDTGRTTLIATEVLFVAGAREPDIAFLRVQNTEGLEPIPLGTATLRINHPIAAVGYPAADAKRNDPRLMDDIFGGRYEVKRFSPGLATGYRDGNVIILADYSTLGGNSGSAVLDLETGEAVALHFAGMFQETNYAVSGDVVKAALRDATSRIITPGADLDHEAERLPASHFDGRAGYDPGFLGDDCRSVPLPGLGARAGDVAPVVGADDDVLRYTHFSVIQSRSRRLPMLTAVNIDGAKAFRLKRRGDWHTDGRLDEAHQVDNVLYRNNPLDRGHLVRRRDPGWGDSQTEAEQGERDTFVYTNCAPQHEHLNQRDWLGLEDYILEAAETRGFKVSVMTGPVFDDLNDRRLRSQPGAEDIQIPGAFWKVATMVNATTAQLSATAYLLTQGDMIRNITEAAFVLGEYRTYQVSLRLIEELTGFDFGPLKDSDPLAAEPESTFGGDVRLVTGPGSLRL